MSFLLRLKNITQLVQVSKNKELFKIKSEMNDVCISENQTVIVNMEGIIHDIGQNEEMELKYKSYQFINDIDCNGLSVIPGFCDAHTHPVFSGDRVHEFIMKLEGKSYAEIAKAGGGILFTTEHTRKSSEQELLDLLLERLNNMQKLGTTLIEAKSGFGLNLETEVKMMKVLKQANQIHPIDIVVNYCQAHAINKGKTEQEETQQIIQDIKEIKKLIDQNEINPEMIDVFCDKGFFERDSTKQILQAGQNIGLKPNFHGDELQFIDSGTLGGELKAQAISHLENLDEQGILSMAQNQVNGVLLPTTHYLLKLKDPPTRKMIESGVIVSLGSDFNPNAYCLSMPFTMNLACINYKMKINEALTASTLNAAQSMGRSHTHGSIEVGKYANFVIINNQNWQHIIYQFGASPIKIVINKGKIVHQQN